MNKKILVIDDDEGILEAFKAMLEFGGYDTTVTSDTKYIYTLKKKNLPHLILLDVLLSGEDGRDICKALKQDAKFKYIPIMMVSAHPSAAKSVLLAGANDFLAKPFDMNDLFKRIEKLLGNKPSTNNY